MKNIAVLTSGGDSPGMNACIRAVVRYGISQGLNVYGVKRGYSGLIENDMELMTTRSVGNIIQTGGTILKTARCNEFKTEEGLSKALKNLREREIEGLVVIGGDGSFRGAEKLIQNGILCACVPGTIDNNLFYTDYTLGFDTATNTVVNMINNVRDTSMSHDRVSIIETMGAGCGDLALNAGLASGADVIIVPEVNFSVEEICKKLINARNHYKEFSIIVLSEHIIEASELARQITEHCGLECRWLILGHVQRGGSPTAFDRNLGTNFGARAVEELLKNNCGVVGYRDGKYIYVTIEEALNGTRKFNEDEYRLAQKLSF